MTKPVTYDTVAGGQCSLFKADDATKEKNGATGADVKRVCRGRNSKKEIVEEEEVNEEDRIVKFAYQR